MKPKIYAILALCIGTVLLLLFTNPQHMPLIVLIVPFVAVFVLLGVVVAAALGYFESEISARKRKVLAALIAAFPLFCLLLQSVGQFSLRDFITLTALFVVLWFYLNRASLA